MPSKTVAVKPATFPPFPSEASSAHQPDLDRIGKPRLIEHQRERSGTNRSQSTKHHSLGDPRHAVSLGKDCSAEQDVDGFLERSLRQGTGLGAVDPVAGDRHKVPTGGHGVDEHGQVAVVDVGA